MLETGKLAKPLTFFAYLVADRGRRDYDRADRERRRRRDGRSTLTIQSWPDDTAWARSGRRAWSPARCRSSPSGSGSPWPRDGGLVVRETVSRSTGGYAGLFDPAGGEVEVAYDAERHVVLHEAAHAWFNGALLADRWANEAFASYYGTEAAAPDSRSRRRGDDT